MPTKPTTQGRIDPMNDPTIRKEKRPDGSIAMFNAQGKHIGTTAAPKTAAQRGTEDGTNDAAYQMAKNSAFASGTAPAAGAEPAPVAGAAPVPAAPARRGYTDASLMRTGMNGNPYMPGGSRDFAIQQKQFGDSMDRVRDGNMSQFNGQVNNADGTQSPVIAGVTQKTPSREDNIAASKLDGTFKNKQDVFNKNNNGQTMDDNGVIAASKMRNSVADRGTYDTVKTADGGVSVTRSAPAAPATVMQGGAATAPAPVEQAPTLSPEEEQGLPPAAEPVYDETKTVKGPDAAPLVAPGVNPARPEAPSYASLIDSASTPAPSAMGASTTYTPPAQVAQAPASKADIYAKDNARLATMAAPVAAPVAQPVAASIAAPVAPAAPAPVAAPAAAPSFDWVNKGAGQSAVDMSKRAELNAYPASTAPVLHSPDGENLAPSGARTPMPVPAPSGMGMQAMTPSTQPFNPTNPLPPLGDVLKASTTSATASIDANAKKFKAPFQLAADVFTKPRNMTGRNGMFPA